MIRPIVDEPTVASGAGGPPPFPGSISIPEYAITERSLNTARRFFSAVNLWRMGIMGVSRAANLVVISPPSLGNMRMDMPTVDLGCI